MADVTGPPAGMLQNKGTMPRASPLQLGLRRAWGHESHRCTEGRVLVWLESRVVHPEDVRPNQNR
jgi:hypothetical protein